MSQLTEPWTVLNDTLMRPGPSLRQPLRASALPGCPSSFSSSCCYAPPICPGRPPGRLQTCISVVYRIFPACTSVQISFPHIFNKKGSFCGVLAPENAKTVSRSIPGDRRNAYFKNELMRLPEQQQQRRRR